MSSEIIIFCDGACSNKNGGWAATISYKEHYREISGSVLDTTNNRMEMTAAIQALRALKKPSTIPIIIRTDSQYLCNAFNKKWIAGWIKKGWKTSQGDPVLNQDLWEVLIPLTKEHQVTWEWVKGHSDNKGNNRCDELAVEARKKLAREQEAG